MRSKKGFTLIELIAVIALIAVLAAIVMFNVVKQQRETKKNLCTQKVNLILSEAESWGQDHLDEIASKANQTANITKTGNQFQYIYLETLIEDGYINEEDIEGGLENPITNKEFNRTNFEIEIYYDVENNQVVVKQVIQEAKGSGIDPLAKPEEANSCEYKE